MSGAVAKPQLRGMLKARTARHFGAAVIFAVACTASYKFLIGSPRKQKYAEFYKTYDIEKDYQRMKEAGVYQSVTTEGVVSDW